MPEDLKGDPEQEERPRNLHADEQPMELAEQEVEAQQSGRRPDDRSGAEAQRDLDAISTRSRDRGPCRDEKAGTGAHDRQHLNQANGPERQEIRCHEETPEIVRSRSLHARSLMLLSSLSPSARCQACRDLRKSDLIGTAGCASPFG